MQTLKVYLCLGILEKIKEEWERLPWPVKNGNLRHVIMNLTPDPVAWQGCAKPSRLRQRKVIINSLKISKWHISITVSDTAQAAKRARNIGKNIMISIVVL